MFLPIFALALSTLQRPVIDQLADSERAFAKMAADVGTRDAFLHYFSDTAVSFSKTGPQNAKNAILSRPAPTGERKAKLVWEPMVADVAGSEDLGYTYGPAGVHLLKDDSVVPDSTQIYFSIWEKESSGDWRVALDIGVPAPAPDTTSFRQAAPIDPMDTGKHDQDPLELERILSRKGRDDDRLARMAFDLVEITPGTKLDNPAFEAWVPSKLALAGGAVSKDKTFAYTYGRYTRKNEKGNYVHVWRRADTASGWSLVVLVRQPS